MNKILITLILAAISLFTLSSCSKKGDLEGSILSGKKFEKIERQNEYYDKVTVIFNRSSFTLIRDFNGYGGQAIETYTGTYTYNEGTQSGLLNATKMTSLDVSKERTKEFSVNTQYRFSIHTISSRGQLRERLRLEDERDSRVLDSI